MYTYNLPNGVKIPCIGYGTLNIKNGENTINAVKKAIENGYRHIDSAEVYGNDEAIGIAIKQSNIKREELFITSKVSNDNRGYNNTIKAFNETLNRLQLAYLDLYLIHWPLARGDQEYCKKINIETWQALETLYKEGKVKAIGVSNFLEHHLNPIIEKATIMPMINQLEIHPGQRQNEIVEFCRNNNILIEAWGPLASGKVLTNNSLIEMARKYNKSVAQICIKWCLQQDIIPLPKTESTDRMKENLNVFDFEISKEDMEKINSMRYFAGSGLHPDKIDF